MKSAVAILTYNRVTVLNTLLNELHEHCPQYPTAVFDDCGQLDETTAYLTRDRERVTDRSFEEVIKAEEWVPKTPGLPTAFLGKKNLGVAGNSNRAIHWFLSRFPDYDHLCILNDDLHVSGDFVKLYGEGHDDLGVGLFCFCDFIGETYRWVYQQAVGKSGKKWMAKVLPRMTGIMMSVTRPCIDAIGYYDARFGKFGEEHCDYTIRARQAGFISLNGSPQNCLDLKHELLRHQDAPTSVFGADRAKADAEAAQIMQQICQEYPYRHPYRPFILGTPRFVGGRDRVGIPRDFLQRYEMVGA